MKYKLQGYLEENGMQEETELNTKPLYAKKTLENYIKQCNIAISTEEPEPAFKLEREILSVFTELPGIKTGLSLYGKVYMNPQVGYKRQPTDNIGDLKLLRAKLQAELDKYDIETNEGGRLNDSEFSSVIKDGEGINEHFDKDQGKTLSNISTDISVFKDTDNSTTYRHEPKILISHATADKEYVEAFIDLLEILHLPDNSVICSSVRGYKIPNGKKIFDYLREQFDNFDLHVIFALSKTYYDSPACLNEMGAAWLAQSKSDVMCLPGFRFKDIKGCLPNDLAGTELGGKEEDIDDWLNQLKDDIVSEFSISQPDSNKWERKRDEFVEKVHTIASEKEKAEKEAKEPDKSTQDDGNDSDDKPDPRPTITVNGVSISFEAQILLAYADDESYSEIMVDADLGGRHVQSGRFEFTEGSTRSATEWESRVDDLENAGLIKNTSKKGDKIFLLTAEGYDIADKVKSEYDIDITADPVQYLQDWDLEKLSELEKVVYDFIKGHSDGINGVTLNQIIVGTRKSQSNVRFAIENLNKEGKLVIVKKGRNTEYKISAKG